MRSPNELAAELHARYQDGDSGGEPAAAMPHEGDGVFHKSPDELAKALCAHKQQYESDPAGTFADRAAGSLGDAAGAAAGAAVFA